MFVDDRPVSTFWHAPGWIMPAPLQSNGALKRPPIVNAESTSSSRSPRRQRGLEPPSLSSQSLSSSLSGLENYIPSFQTFLKQTPPLDHDPSKPLPPTPIKPQQEPASDTYSESRRSSSVYSRTPSQWAPESDASWKTEDFEGDFPSGSRSIAYSICTPDLKDRDPEHEILEPRVFSPLINSPSPTVSSVTLPRSPPGSRPTTTLLPPLIQPMMAARQKVHTVSLQKAIQAKNAPGAVHLLPEELRALKLARVKAPEEVRPDSVDMFGGSEAVSSTINLLPVTDNGTLMESQGRQRVFSDPAITPPATTAHHRGHPFHSPSMAPYENAFHVGSNPVRAMAPPPDSRIMSRDYRSRYPPANEEDRRRKKERGRRSRRSAETQLADGFPSYPDEESRTLVDDYHYLLQEYHRYPCSSSAYGSDDDEDVKIKMKLIPQPLFTGKPPARKSGALRKGSGQSTTLSHKSRSRESLASSARSGVFPLRLSLAGSNESEHRQSGSSTMGIIPISPPSFGETGQSGFPRSPFEIDEVTTNRPVKEKLQQKEKHGREKSRESQFYPHVMRRVAKREEKTKKKQALKSVDETTPKPTRVDDSPPPPGKPLLAIETIAQKLKTPDTTADNMSPLGSCAVGNQKEISNGSAHTNTTSTRKNVFQRVKGMTKKTVVTSRRRSSTLTTSTTDYDPHPDFSSPIFSQASPSSPHLFPSPVADRPQLTPGWSETAQWNFDRARSPPPPPFAPNKSILTDIVLPARPLDRRVVGDESESPTGSRDINNKAGLFGTVRDRWMENKVQKRREELKRMIKVLSVNELEVEGKGKGRVRMGMEGVERVVLGRG